jgi:hypothetical protein
MSREMTNSEAISNLNHIYGIVSSDIQRSLDVAFKALEERPQGEWGKWIVAEIQCPNCFEYFETDCYSTGELNKCPNCGADLKGGAAIHKPNCVTCDHFGKCEGCEKGEEE